jgi:hypothetical protein
MLCSRRADPAPIPPPSQKPAVASARWCWMAAATTSGTRGTFHPTRPGRFIEQRWDGACGLGVVWETVFGGERSATLTGPSRSVARLGGA